MPTNLTDFFWLLLVVCVFLLWYVIQEWLRSIKEKRAVQHRIIEDLRKDIIKLQHEHTLFAQRSELDALRSAMWNSVDELRKHDIQRLYDLIKEETRMFREEINGLGESLRSEVRAIRTELKP